MQKLDRRSFREKRVAPPFMMPNPCKYVSLIPHSLHTTAYIVSWEPEGRYCRSSMFRWEPEGRYRHTLCTAIAPFWFSTKHAWSAVTPFWLSTDYIWSYGQNYVIYIESQKCAINNLKCSVENQKGVVAVQSLWWCQFSTEHLWIMIAPLWLSTGRYFSYISAALIAHISNYMANLHLKS